MARVGIIDYGYGNLFSIQRALTYLKQDSFISEDPTSLSEASHLILPGVGAFGDGMKGLCERGLDRSVKAWADEGKPLLGICLGMQLLLSMSEEFGEHQGLDLIPGRVRRFPDVYQEGEKVRVPNIGWCEILTPELGWQDSLFKATKDQENMYFVHSYYADVEAPSHVLATSEYAGVEYASAIVKDSVVGTQFHPEKSGLAGLEILKNFCEGSLDG